MERAVTEARTRSPEENLQIAIIQQAFSDAFELGVGHNLSNAEIQQARNWFHTRHCTEVCDRIGTTRDHILKLYNILSTRYKSGLITKDDIRKAVRKLELKI